MAFSDTYSIITPAGSSDPKEGDDRIRELKRAVQERENVDHYWPIDTNLVDDVDAGEHRMATLREGSAPTQAADKIKVYGKDVNSKCELHARDEDGNEVQITSAGTIAFVTGSVQMYAGSSSPTWWLICDGRAVSRTTYADLFAIIDVTFGIGDGSTTFNLPDARGKSPVGTNDAGLPNGADSNFTTRNEGDEGGAETHTLTAAELAAHDHNVVSGGNHTHNLGWRETGAQPDGRIVTDRMDDPETQTDTTAIKAAGAHTHTVDDSGKTRDTAHNTMSPFFVMNFIIKT